MLDEGQSVIGAVSVNTNVKRVSTDRSALKIISCNEEELTAHQLRLDAIEKASGACIWNQ